MPYETFIKQFSEGFDRATIADVMAFVKDRFATNCKIHYEMLPVPSEQGGGWLATPNGVRVEL